MERSNGIPMEIVRLLLGHSCKSQWVPFAVELMVNKKCYSVNIKGQITPLKLNEAINLLIVYFIIKLIGAVCCQIKGIPNHHYQNEPSI